MRDISAHRLKIHLILLSILLLSLPILHAPLMNVVSAPATGGETNVSVVTFQAPGASQVNEIAGGLDWIPLCVNDWDCVWTFGYVWSG